MTTETVQRTIYAAHLQTCKQLNKRFTLLPNSTLNQKFNVAADEAPAIDVFPSLSYIAIGNRGSTYEMGAGNFVLSSPVPHLPWHAALYNHIPFVLRLASDDLTPAERTRYRLRVPLTVGGVQYFAYYLRVLNLEQTVPAVEIRNVSGTTITNDPYEPPLAALSPEHPVLSGTNLNTADGDYLVSTAKMDFILNQSDITNIREACQILFGDPRYAVINEVAVCSGVDRAVSGVFGGGTINYTESIAAQVAVFLSQTHELTASTTEVRIGLNAGSVEPIPV